jgi:hypothetical protein
MRTVDTMRGLLAVLAIAAAGCSGFGETCSSNAQCPVGSACDPTLKVCFVVPGVTQIQPANGATSVPAANAVITATFSGPVADAGVKFDTFVVTGQGFHTPGSYAANADSTQVTFHPSAGGLALGTTYTVDLTGIKDVSGNPIPDFSSTFSTADGAWQPAVPYTATGTYSGLFNYSAAANYLGQLTTAVDARVGMTSEYDLVAGVVDAGADPVFDHTVYGIVGDDAFGQSSAISDDGRAFVAFSVSNATGEYAKVATSDPTAHTWSTAQDLSVPVSTATTGAQVVAVPGGRAMASWLEQVSGKYKVRARKYDPSTGWGTVLLVEDDAAVDAQELVSAADQNNNVLVAWMDSGISPLQVVVAYFTSGSFTAPLTLSNAAFDSLDPELALNDSGAGAVVWEAKDGSGSSGSYHVYASTFDPNTLTFTAEVKLDVSTTSANTPFVGVAASGDAVAVWIEPAGTTGTSVVAARFSAASGTWAAPETIYTDTNGAPGVRIAVDPVGNALVAWPQYNGTVFTMFGRRLASGNWVPPLAQLPTQLVPTSTTDSLYNYPAIAVDGTGHGTVLVGMSNSTTTFVYYVAFK